VARGPRIEYAGAIHHVFARGNNRRIIFRDDRDRLLYVRLLARTVRWKRWRCLAYCLMNNHVHLLVETPWANLGEGIQWLHGLYARTVNDCHGDSGHVFQGRFGSTLVTSDEQLLHGAAYVVRNPVRAGLCRHPRDWRWSSYNATVGRQPPSWLDVDALFRHVGAAGGDPRRRYEELVLGRTRRNAATALDA
jgi:REP element-mobilizing transposase RayT